MPRIMWVGQDRYDWIKFNLWRENDFCCTYCARVIPPESRQLDHIVPVALDHWDDPLNVVPCCAWCNASKGSRVARHWISNRLKDRLVALGWRPRDAEVWCSRLRLVAEHVERAWVAKNHDVGADWFETETRFSRTW